MLAHHKQGLAVVTGASSGIGAAFAEQFVLDGHPVVLVARRSDRLQALASRLQALDSAGVEVLAGDLTDPGFVHDLEQRLATAPEINYLVNNAGFGAVKPFAQCDIDVAEAQIRLQTITLVRLTYAALSPMLEREAGNIINVSSLMAFAPRINNATYAASKSFITTFTEILHAEVAGTGVRVQAVCPGPVQTEWFNRAGMDASGISADTLMTAKNVVNASLASLAIGEAICVPGLENPAAVKAVRDAQAALVAHGRQGTLATRYR